MSEFSLLSYQRRGNKKACNRYRLQRIEIRINIPDKASISENI